MKQRRRTTNSRVSLKICDKNFANKFTLTTHTASVHEDRKAYKC